MEDDKAAWTTQVRQAIQSGNLEGLKELTKTGQNLDTMIDDDGNTALSLATYLGHEEMVGFLLQTHGSSLSREDILSSCLTALYTLASTRNTQYLHILVTVMTSRSRTQLPYVVVLQAAFKILRTPPKDLLVLFCETALRLMPDLCRDISLNMVLYEETECYWQLLSHGISLNDIWPVNCEENPYSKYDTAHNLFDIYFTHGCLFTLHTSSRNKITKMTIQAANGEASPAVLYVIQNFPTDLYDDVFKFLTLAGFKMSPAAVQRMANMTINTAGHLIRWYKDFYCRPQSLKHLCRLTVRQNLRTNVVHAVQQILLPEDLKRYLLITDLSSY
ncbi:hypothetical protein BaRGS_00022114 [Batillaria attramentaria]|uniref:SOCS box domain-containing protein n=1 Tax=Batillaria attramentaria TaxID=370345 RepID=A0ABD0KHE3_9CAEN